jgi:hypothetical protein
MLPHIVCAPLYCVCSPILCVLPYMCEGPRAWTFRQEGRWGGMAALLDTSDVVLMTEEEAQAVTGEADAAAAARWVWLGGGGG